MKALRICGTLSALCLCLACGSAAKKTPAPAPGGGSTGGAPGGGGGVPGIPTGPSTGGTVGSVGGSGGIASSGDASMGTEPDAPPASLCLATTIAMGDMGLIDDFDDGDANTLAYDGRGGDWWLWVPMEAMVSTPKANAALIPELGGIGAVEDAGAPDARVRDAGRDTRRSVDASASVSEGGAPTDDGGTVAGPHVAHIKGTTIPGADGFSIDAHAVPVGLCYDATKYTGISVWTKGNIDPNIVVYLTVGTAAVKAAAGMAGPNRLAIPVSKDWKQVKVAFADLGPGWGAPVPFDATQILTLGISLHADPLATPDGGANPDAAVPLSKFDVYFDNFAFY
jgi:hypothetical protein